LIQQETIHVLVFTTKLIERERMVQIDILIDTHLYIQLVSSFRFRILI